MAKIGTNIGFYPQASRLSLLDQVPGVKALRFPLRQASDDTALIGELQTRGILPWVVLDSGAFEGFGSRSEAFANYAARYLSLGVVWEVGNEPDITSPASWTMDPADFSHLLLEARAGLGADAYLVAGGLAAGDPGWLRTVTTLSSVNAVGIHPYGKWPTDAPVNGGWGFGPVLPLLQGYRDQLDGMGLSHIGLHVTEYGAPRNELGDHFSAYQRDMTQTLAATPLLGYALQFCLTDLDVAPFGLFDSYGTQQATLDIPEEGAPVPAPAPVPVAPSTDPWEHFSAWDIANATQIPQDKIEANWPRIVAQLVLVGLNDRATQIAAIGTVAIETASTFEPVREAFWTSEAWRQANLRYYPWYGRGYIQVTWEANYRSYGRAVNELWNAGGAIDLIARPDDALDPDVAAAVLALYFRDHKTAQGYSISQAANAGDWEWVRRLVQGGTAGLDRLVTIANALNAVPEPVHHPVPDPVQPAAPCEDCSDFKARAERAEALLAQVRGLLAA